MVTVVNIWGWFYCRFLNKYPENPTAKDKHVISLDEIAKELGMYMYSKIQYDLNIYLKNRLFFVLDVHTKV
jgi:hypothetical protein